VGVVMNQAAIIETMDTKRTYAEGVDFGKNEITSYIESLLPDYFSRSKEWLKAGAILRIEWLKELHLLMIQERASCYTNIKKQDDEIDRLNKIIAEWITKESYYQETGNLPSEPIDFNSRYLENIGEG
jgi:hemerythrin